MRNKRRRRSAFDTNLFDSLRWRFRDRGTDGGGGGPSGATDQTAAPDIAPSNGGPDRDFDSLSGGTIDGTPSGGPSQSGGQQAAPSQARTPADPNQAAGVVQSAAQTAPQNDWIGILDAGRQRGFTFDHTVTDDASALDYILRLAQSNRQADVHAQLGRQLAPHADRIRTFLGSPANPQTQAQSAPAERKPWEAPEFNPQWLALVDREPTTGLFVAKPGVRTELAEAVNAYAEWKQRFDQNPAAVINQQIEARAQEIANKQFDERFAERERQSTIQQIVHDNSGFLYQRDQSGRTQLDFQGQPIISQLGAAYIEQLRNVQAAGVSDPRQADALAKNLVRGQLALAAQSQGQQQANPQTQQQFHQPNRNGAQANGSQQRQYDPAATEPNEEGMSLHERMLAALKGNGVSREDIEASVSGGA